MAKRQKTVFTNSELPHQWVHNSHIEYGRNSNHSMSFEGNLFFSYRTAIAQIIRRDEKHGGTYVLMSNDTFSPTTSKHQHDVRSAVRHFPILYVPFFGKNPGDIEYAWNEKTKSTDKKDAFKLQHKNNVQWFTEELNKASRAVSSANRANKLGKLLAYARIAEESRKYLSVTRCKLSIKYPIAIPAEKFEADWCGIRIINSATWTGGERVKSELEELIDSSRAAATAAERSRNEARERRYRVDRLLDSPLKQSLEGKSSDYLRKHWSELLPQIEKAEALRDARYTINALNGWRATDESRALYAQLAPLTDDELEARKEEIQSLIDDYKAREREIQEREIQEREQQQALELEEKCNLWRRNELKAPLPYGAPTMLRIEPDGRHVQTSKGARVSVEAARKALRFVSVILMRVHAPINGDNLPESEQIAWKRNGETFPIGIYQLDKVMMDGTVHAGCHIISREEQTRLAMLIDERITEGTTSDTEEVSE
jgi:hypothetical protein